MKRTILGILLGGVAVYFWGFLFWGISGIPYMTWKHATNEPAAMAALKVHFPEAGAYYVPGMREDQVELESWLGLGPVGFVHITAPEGRSLMVPSIMFGGFILCLVQAALAAALLAMVGGALPNYGAKVKVLALVGIIVVTTAHLGDVIWWQLALDWKLAQGFYDAAAFVILGLVLGKFSSSS